MTGALLDVPDVALLANRSRATIWRWASNGQIPACAIVKFGRVSRFKHDALIAAGLLPSIPVAQEVSFDLG